MSLPKKKKLTEPKENKPDPKTKKTKTVKALRDRHLKNKDHVITDQDLQDLDLELGHPDRSSTHTPELPSKSQRPKDEDKDPKRVTPWDLIDD